MIGSTYHQPAVSLSTNEYSCSGSLTKGNQSFTAFDAVLDQLDERITDQLNPASRGNKVVHRRQKRIINASAEAFKLPNTSGPRTIEYVGGSSQWMHSHDVFVGEVTGWDVSSDSSLPKRWSLQSPPGTNEDILIEDVFERARQLKADHLLNIITAHEIPSSLSTLMEIPKGLATGEIGWWRINRLIKSLPKLEAGWKSIRRVLRTASNQYLAYKFGIAPLVADIMATHKFLTHVSEDWKRHKDGKILSFSRAYGPLIAFDDTSYVRDVYNGKKISETTVQGSLEVEPVVRYVLSVKPRSDGSDDLTKAVDFLQSRFSTSPASLAWELVPFSFVADWFVDLRGVLRLLDKMVGFEPYKVVGFTRSLTYQVRTDVFHVYRSCCDGSDLGPVRNCGSVDCKHYERIPIPSAKYTPSWKVRFGKNQARISAALLSQQLSRL